MIQYLLLFIFCAGLIYFATDIAVGSLMRMARFLGWKEFVVAFFMMAFAASVPNFFVGFSSALRGIPELSFGDVAGNNLVALTLVVSLAVFFVKGKVIPVESRAIRSASVFTTIAVFLPLLLVLDGNLSRIDGVLLISFFVFYIVWLFSKEERFKKVYGDHNHAEPPVKQFKFFIKDIGKLFLSALILIAATQGIIISAQFFSLSFHTPLILIGILITGPISALPEIYFGVTSARRGQTWMVLGNLIGAVIIPTTLVLGSVAIINPIEKIDFETFAIARLFLMLAAISFLVSVKTEHRITRTEAVILILIYVVFVVVEVLTK